MAYKVLLSIISSVLLALSFSFPELSLLAWIFFIPVLSTVKNSKAGTSFFLFYIFGIVFLMLHFSWITSVEGVQIKDFLLMGIYLGGYFALFGAGLNIFSKMKSIPLVVFGSALWVALEYLRSHAGFLALPWALLGHSQYNNLSLIQISSWTGVYGVSFLIVMSNIALSNVIQKEKRSYQGLGVVVAVIFIVLIYGKNELREAPAKNELSLTVVQGNIPQEIKWKREYEKQNLKKHLVLTRKASAVTSAQLIIWPETAVQGSFRQNISLTRTIFDLARETGSYIVLGGAQRPKGGNNADWYENWHNSAFLISSEGKVAGQYNKIRLLPFAEYTPLQNIIPWPSRYLNRTDYKPGEEYTLFKINDVSFGTTICWENIFPDIFRRFVQDGAKFMVNITNEAWFRESRALEQFLSMNVFRAVENNIAVVRAANTGISCFIDPRGRILEKVEEDSKTVCVEGFLTSGIPFSDKVTFFTKHGDLFTFINIAISVAALLFSACRLAFGLASEANLNEVSVANEKSKNF